MEDALHMRSRGAALTLENTRFYVKPDEARAIRAPKPTAVPSGTVAIEMRNSSVTGPSGRGETAPETILIEGRPESSIVDSCIHQTGADKDGVKIVDSDGTVSGTAVSTWTAKRPSSKTASASRPRR